ncbi:MAG: M20/M25/M40 family metallo-hydrolase [Litorimonas sp.]
MKIGARSKNAKKDLDVITISEDNIKQHLARLIAFDTRNGSGDEVACVNYLRDELARFSPDKLIVEEVPRSRGKSNSAFVLAIWGSPKTVLNVHIDTVPSGQGWDSDPLELLEKNGRLIGLGSSDIKGAAACILAALETTVPKNVAVLLSGDEEHGSEVMPALIKAGHLNGVVNAIVCEPTSCRVGRRHRGMLAIRADFSGPGGHSSLADTTIRPLLGAARLAASIGDYADAHMDFGVEPYKGLCVNIGELRSDGAYNVIPTHASLFMSMRPPPGDEVMLRRSEIYAMAKRLCPEAKLDTIVAFEPFATKDISVFEGFFKGSEIVDLPYWTEAAMMSAAGINTVVYGPGNIEQAHKPNEYVEIEQLTIAAQHYARALLGGMS